MKRLILLFIIPIFYFGVMSCLQNSPSSGDIPPQNVKAETYSQRAITISWDENANAESFNVYFSTTSGFTPADSNKLTNTEENSYLHTGLESGTTYYYIVSAVYSGSVLKPAEEVNAVPRFLGVLDESYGTDGLVSKRASFAMEDSCFSSKIDHDGNVVVVIGYLPSFTVYKFDSDGNQIMDFGEDGNVFVSGTGFVCEKMAIDSEDNIYIAGTKEDDVSENERIYVWTMSSDGSNLKSISFGEAGRGRDVYVDSDDNVYILGKVIDGEDNNRVIWQLKNNNLNEIFEITEFDEGTESMDSLYVDDDGSFYVAGSFEPSDAEEDEEYPRLIKFKHDGTRDTSFGVNGDAKYNDDREMGDLDYIMINNSGTIYTSGTTTTGEESSDQATIFKYSPSLKKLVKFYESDDIPSVISSFIFTDQGDMILPSVKVMPFGSGQTIVSDFLALDLNADLVSSIFDSGIYEFPRTPFVFSFFVETNADLLGRILFSGVLMESESKSYLGVARFR